MRRGVAVWGLFARRWFPELLGTRLVAQCADGVFQASLASAVFFNPEHQTDPAQAAAGFVVLLLPYSLVGPFAGVFLDRWRRQRVLVWASVVRALLVAGTAVVVSEVGPRGPAFYVVALAVLSVSRLYLAALSASLPHVVRHDQLVTANAVTTTAGTAMSIVGVGLGLVVRRLAGDGSAGSAVIALVGAAVYLLAVAPAVRIPARLLGPHQVDRAPLRHQLAGVVHGLVAGARHVAERRRAGRALGAIGATRLVFGMSTIGTLLLYRNYFHDEGLLRAGIVGLGQAFAAAAVGSVLAAVATPLAASRLGTSRWITVCLASAAVIQLVCGLPFRPGPLVVGAGLLGFTTQAVKICVDTTVQTDVADDYRGRVFSLYDTLFNVSFVAAALVAPAVMPATGRSYPVLAALVTGYALTAFLFGRAERRAAQRREPAPALAGPVIGAAG